MNDSAQMASRDGAKICQCEHIDHETPTEAVHPYLAPHALAGGARAMHVGPVCDDCARDHLADYLVS